jgi:hypothetical protein
VYAYTTYEDGAVCSETSAHKIQTPGSHPKERIQHREDGENLKSRMFCVLAGIRGKCKNCGEVKQLHLSESNNLIRNEME